MYKHLKNEEKQDESYINLLNQINKKIDVNSLKNKHNLSDEEFSDIVSKIKSSIGSLKKKSIMAKALQLVEEANIKDNYWGKSKREFFKYCYQIRSNFIHSGTYDVKSDKDKLNLLNKVLDHFIIDILDSMNES